MNVEEKLIKVEVGNDLFTCITIKDIKFGVGIVGYELRQDAVDKPILELYVNRKMVDLVVKELIKTNLEYTVENWIIEENTRIIIAF